MHLAALFLFALPTSFAQAEDGASARVEVLEGRALLAGEGAVARLEAGGPERRIDGAAHLELPAGSRARVTWGGRASLVLEGRNVIAWHPGGDGVPPAWDLAEVGLAHLELRRGPLDVALAGGWGARLHSGACALRGLPGDGVELDHQAGLPFDLWPPQRSAAPSAPFTVLAGARVRLMAATARPLALQGSQARLRDPHQRFAFEREQAPSGFPPWRGFAWPWASALPTAPIEAALPAAAAPDLPAAPAPAASEPAPAPPAEVHVPIPAPVLAPAAPFTSQVRERGVLVLTPYGPRWLDASRAVDPALRRTQAARERP